MRLMEARRRACGLAIACAVGAYCSMTLAVRPSFAAEPISSATIDRNGSRFDIVIHHTNASEQRGTVVLLHGFPGNAVGKLGAESQRSLTATLGVAGFNVVQFNYVGSWANAGQFSWFGSVHDVEAVVRYLRNLKANTSDIDGSRIVLVGHSYGGWVALTAAGRDPSLRCVATLASANQGQTGHLLQTDRNFYERRVALYHDVLSAPNSPIRAFGAKALAEDAMAHATSWNLVNMAALLRPKQLLFVIAGQDSVVPSDVFLQPLLNALLLEGAPSIRRIVIDGADHNFRQHKPEVDAIVVKWVTTECKF